MTELALIPTSAALALSTGPLDRNPAAVYLASLAPGSRRTMHEALTTIGEMVSPGHGDALGLPWQRLRYQHTQAIRSRLAERYAAATANKCMSALRRVLAESWRLGLMPAEDYRRAVDLKGVKGATVPAGRALTAGEIAAILDGCANDPSASGARDGALIALLRAGGLRRAEVCSLDLADYTPGDGALKVKGKGNKERLAYVGGGAAEALEDWLTLRGQDPGPLFCPVRKGGQVIPGQRLTPQAVYNLLAKRAGAASVKDLSPHDLRRTFVSDLLDAGADIATVQRMAGHASVTTTARYDRRGEEAKKKAAAMLHVPWRRPRMGA